MHKNWLVITASTQEKAYKIAAEEFIKYYKQITGETLTLSDTDDGESNLVLIGNWAVNPIVTKYTVDGLLPKRLVRSGTDEFLVKTCALGDRKVLLLQGGLGRSTLYAVYAYFEALGCRWYWDGDVVPTLSSEEVMEKELDILEKPRFLYRGLRYFAHRGAKRFRAETWGLEDWKKEIDYLTKRRLNLFMLRIGQDDLFQRAFPAEVRYPNEQTMNALCREKDYLCGGFEDRRLFWSLEYRGKLRQQLLAYAFDRGFMHPEDFGTMTHWYSLTPQDFLDKKQPTFFKNHTGYDEKGCIWDIREEKNFEYYMQLTKAHIQAFGKPDLFHTIGFAERQMYPDDKEKNLAMKTYVYERYTQRLNEEYPNSPILIASWDYWLTYSPEEVCASLSQMDKKSCILFDYTSDSMYLNNFTYWNVVGNFPYVFGIFQGYESFNDCVGYYPITEERMQIAKADEYCKGLIFWPEISHSDTLMQEFFMKNTWEKEVVGVDCALESMCQGRYREYRVQMQRAWQETLPIIQLLHWSMPKDYFSDWAEYNFFNVGRSFLTPVLSGEREKAFSDGLRSFEKAKKALENARNCLNVLADLPSAALQDEFIRRDATDLMRTVVGRYVHFSLIAQAEALEKCVQGEDKKQEVCRLGAQAQTLLTYLCKILSSSKEFSLYHTILELDKTEKIYDGFELTMKHNTINWYCRSNDYETVKEVLIPEMKKAQETVAACVESGAYQKEERLKAYNQASSAIVTAYLQKPFAQIDKEEKSDFDTLRKEISEYFKGVQL